MQQIYRQRDEQLEVYTTVFSPRVCKNRKGHVDTQKWQVVEVQMEYRSRWPKELDLNPGDLIQVLFKEDETWWFGRLVNGDEGYFPVACVELLQDRDSSKTTPSLLRRGSVPAIVETTRPPCGCTSGHNTPKLLRKNSIQRQLQLSRTPTKAEPGASTTPQRSHSLLHRVLSKSRRKSCPHIPHSHMDTSSDNDGFQPD
ncbi:uncharacterized protein si:dkey-97a13.12 [Oryzias melastigma]|uniref:uncharacterized protein si:dkey-97a13.12 n=1 Tax=Oryzias melastigma TaxID=30732 RepID=UPI000CF80479|nr:uncharacterized protein si:dkey-97a13.12 [Oryzias melastigma]